MHYFSVSRRARIISIYRCGLRSIARPENIPSPITRTRGDLKPRHLLLMLFTAITLVTYRQPVEPGRRYHRRHRSCRRSNLYNAFHVAPGSIYDLCPVPMTAPVLKSRCKQLPEDLACVRGLDVAGAGDPLERRHSPGAVLHVLSAIDRKRSLKSIETLISSDVKRPLDVGQTMKAS